MSDHTDTWPRDIELVGSTLRLLYSYVPRAHAEALDENAGRETAAQCTAVDALHHYRNTAAPTDADRRAADAAVSAFATEAAISYREAFVVVTRATLDRERRDRDDAVAEALAADRETAADRAAWDAQDA